MTELHNMSVAPRSVLTVQREALHGRRYRVAIGASPVGKRARPNDAALTRCFRADGAACALAVLQSGALTATGFLQDVARFRGASAPAVTLRRLCDTGLSELHLPAGFGFF